MGGDAELEGIAVGPLRNGELLLSGSSHAVFVDGSDNNGGAVATSQLKHLEEAFFAVFVVG